MLAVEINGPIVSTFVNDIKIMEAKAFRIISSVKQEMMTVFKITDMEPISFYLSFKISRNCKKKIIKLF